MSEEMTDGWVKHKGTRNPYPEKTVQVRYQDGADDEGPSYCFIWNSRRKDAEHTVPTHVREVTP